MVAMNVPFVPAASERDRPARLDSAPERDVDGLMIELTTTRDRLLRCLAEQENVRREAQRDRDEAVRYAASQFAGDLLHTADNLERAIASVPEEKHGDPAVAGLLAGIEATRRALHDTFAKHGLRRLEPTGEKFDPNWHEAIFDVADGSHPPDVVASVLQPGYIHYDRLLRPALVAVSKAPAAPTMSGETGCHADG